MNCFNHPTVNAIGVCSICGKGLCAQCVKTIEDKLICKTCFTPSKTVVAELKRYTMIGAALGWLGSVNVTLIGVYAALKLFHLGTMRGYQMEVYVVSILTLMLTSTLLVGGYRFWRGNIRMGGILTSVAGIATLLMYGYFTLYMPLLRELGAVGFLLCLPALISGMLGLISDRFFKNM